MISSITGALEDVSAKVSAKEILRTQNNENTRLKYLPKNTVSFLVVFSPLMHTDFNSTSAENSQQIDTPLHFFIIQLVSASY